MKWIDNRGTLASLWSIDIWENMDTCVDGEVRWRTK